VCGLVLFEVELALEGLIDRLDDLPQWFEQRGSGPLRFALAGWPQQPDAVPPANSTSSTA